MSKSISPETNILVKSEKLINVVEFPSLFPFLIILPAAAAGCFIDECLQTCMMPQKNIFPRGWAALPRALGCILFSPSFHERMEECSEFMECLMAQNRFSSFSAPSPSVPSISSSTSALSD